MKILAFKTITQLNECTGFNTMLTKPVYEQISYEGMHIKIAHDLNRGLFM